MGRFGGFCGGSYTSESPNVAAEFCLNWYAEKVESGGKTPVAMYPTPGLEPMFTLTAGWPVVALDRCYDKYYAICNGTFYQWDANAAPVNIGNAGTSTFIPGSIACNNARQVIFCTAGKLFLWNFTTTVQVGASLAVNFAKVVFLDGYFVAYVANAQKFYISGLEDGTTWDPLDVAQISVFSENIVDMALLHRQLWFFGANNAVAYYDSGDPNFPFEPIPGGYMDHGALGGELSIGGSYTTTTVDNTLFWIGSDARGTLTAWRLDGYTPVRISNHAVETAWQGYRSNSIWPTLHSTKTFTYSYQENGHIFWVVQLCTGGGGNSPFVGTYQTWVYDVSTGLWHQRGQMVAGVLQGNKPLVCVSAHDTHFVGGTDGVLYRMDADIKTDNTQPITRIRRSPYTQNDGLRLVYPSFRVDMETGTEPGAGVIVSLRWSDDGGHTWSNYHQINAGALGQYGYRVIWRRLGQDRFNGRVWEFSCSDTNSLKIVDAYLEAIPERVALSA